MPEHTTQDNIELVLNGWLLPSRRRDLATLERHLDQDVVWQAANGEIGCRNRDDVLEMIGGELSPITRADRLDILAAGNRVVVGVRSDELDEVAGVRLDGQLFWVVTIRDGRIAQIQDHARRADALAAAGATAIADWW